MKLIFFLLLTMLSTVGFANSNIFDDDVGYDGPQVELVSMDIQAPACVSMEKETKQDLLSSKCQVQTWSYYLLDFKQGLSEIARTIKFIQDKTVLDYPLCFGLSDRA